LASYFGKALRRFRNEKEIYSQTELARQLNRNVFPISPAAISHYERGERTPSPEFLRAIVQLLDLTKEETDTLIHAITLDMTVRFLAELDDIPLHNEGLPEEKKERNKEE